MTLWEKGPFMHVDASPGERFHTRMPLRPALHLSEHLMPVCGQMLRRTGPQFFRATPRIAAHGANEGDLHEMAKAEPSRGKTNGDEMFSSLKKVTWPALEILIQSV